MDSKSSIKTLNLVYKPLHECRVNIFKELKKLNYDVEWGYYAFHSVKLRDEFVTEIFPIPVITVKDICDIGIDLENIFIEGKLERNAAIKFDFSLLKDYNFEVYGAEDYLNDFYNKDLYISEIGNKIEKSEEKEICISVFFEFNTSASKIIEVVRNYSNWNTYIL